MAGLIGNQGGDHFAYLGGFRKAVTKGDDAKVAAHPPKNASVAVRRDAPAPSFGDNHKAGTENIEGNESPKYEAMEKKSLRSLKHGGTDSELRAGHNTKNWIAGAIKHPGALHEELGVKPGKKIPAKKLAAASAGKYGAKAEKRANLAKTLKGFHK